jgi:outer membrane receptor protein involved in Fe transport
VVPCGGCISTSVGADGYGYWQQFQYFNLGSIRNQGWELQGSANLGSLRTRGTYSWTKSRVIGVNPEYRARFANQPQYQPGATFRYLPEHTWALGVTYARAGSFVALDFTGTGQVKNQPNEFTLRNLVGNVRLTQNRLNLNNNGNAYSNFNAGYALADLTASHRFAARVEALLQVQNLSDRYIKDESAGNAVMGRQIKAGFRIKTQ